MYALAGPGARFAQRDDQFRGRGRETDVDDLPVWRDVVRAGPAALALWLPGQLDPRAVEQNPRVPHAVGFTSPQPAPCQAPQASPTRRARDGRPRAWCVLVTAGRVQRRLPAV